MANLVSRQLKIIYDEHGLHGLRMRSIDLRRSEASRAIMSMVMILANNDSVLAFSNGSPWQIVASLKGQLSTEFGLF